MTVLTLKVGETRPVPTSKAYLNILSASANFIVESPEIGRLTGKTNKRFEMGTFRSVDFVNESNASIDIEFEIANIKTTSSGESNVNVQNEVVVKRIVEAIQVNASATVEDGKMSKKVANIFQPIDAAKVSIEAGATIEVFPARAALNRKVTLQLITDNPDMSEIRVGNSADNTTATKGIFMKGHEDVPAVYQWETETAVFVHNPNLTAITLAGGEEWRA
jgi:hypothetical protein